MDLLIGPEMIRTVSLLLLLLLLMQLGVAILARLRRAVAERRIEELRLAHWRERVAAAAARTRTVERALPGWEGWRKFEVERIVEESPTTRSLYLRPHDRRPLPGFLPGQHLTFQLRIPGQERPVIRCYSLSAAPDPGHYRISVKRVRFTRPDGTPHDGLSSSFLHDRVRIGDILDVKAPAGEFHLGTAQDGPLVLIAGGVGITPFVSMLGDLLDAGTRREVWLFYSVLNGGDRPFVESLRGLAREHEQFHLRLVHSRPLVGEQAGRDYDHGGRIDRDYLARELPSSNYDFFLCGPPAMMACLTEQLATWGVPRERLHSEAFGPAAIPPQATVNAVEVRFERSGRSLQWEGGTLLELAEQSGIAMESGCRAGSCGACLTAIKSGEVEYLQPPGIVPEQGSCLACVSAPKGPLVLDA